ncbi:MAG TPA: 50S ribosomal protein L33 [Patescibacteria group bacterium]|nr:50S ribosomal protein L33 [Patescibacteria group bacterium]
MAKKEQRFLVGMKCSVCNSQNYVTERNRTNTPDALQLTKYCKVCKKATPHKEMKKLK